MVISFLSKIHSCSKLYASLGGKPPEIVGQSLFRVKERYLPLRRMQRDVQRLATGLPLHVRYRHIHIKMLRTDVPQLMLQNFVLFFLREQGVYVDTEGAVGVWYGDPLYLYRQADETDKIVSHPARPRLSPPL